MYDLCQWKFLHSIHDNFSYGATPFKHLDTGIDHFEFVYNCHSPNSSYMKFTVISKFAYNRPRLLLVFFFSLVFLFILLCQIKMYICHLTFYLDRMAQK